MRLKRFSAYVLLTFIAQQSFVFCQDTASVLFIGNSYTFYNGGLPSIFQSIATSKGDMVTFDSQTQGGATMNTHANNAATYTKINSQPWDFVVLQGQSQEPSFPDSQVDQNTIPPAMRIADSIYANNFCTEMMLFMTWGYVNGDSQWGPISTYDGMQDRLRNGYARMADSCQASVSPVGIAWRYVRQNYPMINLYASDGSHPNYAGSYLAACTFYASIFRKSPVGASFIGSLDATTAGQLQEAAALMVLDSLSTWKLRPMSEHTQGDFTYQMNGTTVDFTGNYWKAQSVLWNFGDGNTSTDWNPSHTFAPGNYTVEMITSSACDSDTSIQTFNFSSSGIEEHGLMPLAIRSKPNNQFELLNLIPEEIITISTSTGQIIHQQKAIAETLCIDLSHVKSGVYFIKTSSHRTLKLLVAPTN